MWTEESEQLRRDAQQKTYRRGPLPMKDLKGPGFRGMFSQTAVYAVAGYRNLEAAQQIEVCYDETGGEWYVLDPSVPLSPL